MNPIPKDPSGWWLSEKLDGVFCRWSGTAFLSRNGHRFTPPASWLIGMPSSMLDGELWMGRGTFDSLVSSIQRRKSDWQGIRFMVFDLAQLHLPIEARHAALGRLQLPPWVQLVNHRRCLSEADLDASEAGVVSSGGEGLVLREPQSFYRPGNFIKVKRYHRDLDRSMLD